MHDARRIVFTSAKAALFSFFAAVFVALVLYFTAGYALSGSNENICRVNYLPGLFLGIVFVAPLIETVVLAAIYGLARFFFSAIASARLAAIILALLHSLVWWGWTLILIVPFLVFANPLSSYRNGIESRVAASLFTHGFHNFYVFLVTAMAVWGDC
ncbi:hypothetical protein [Pseudoxanthomonas putridarboris]|uniref:CAAX protease self-immunity n=1 Tax=Pseudoxanthomonas putridarboris TaxID=752605 RepID=A0ABU9IXL3_9GAMM